MFCEKCGKKISYKKAQCDNCKQPVEYEGFSKFEYETVAKPELIVNTAPKMESVAPSVPQSKGLGKLIAITCAAVATVIIVSAGLIALVLSDRQSEKTPAVAKPPVESEESYELITTDATLKVKFSDENAKKYTYIVTKLSEEETIIFEGDEKTEGKLCADGEALETGDVYEICIKGDGKITKDKEITKTFKVSDKEDDKDLKTEIEVTLIGFTDEEIYERDVFTKYGEKDYQYAYVDFDGGYKKELIIRENTKKYTIYYINEHRAEKVKKGEFEADELYINFGKNAFYGKVTNKPDEDKDDKYFKFNLKDGKLTKEDLKKKPDDLGLPYIEFKSKNESN